MGRASLSGREGCWPAAGLGRGECGQRAPRKSGRTLHRSEGVAEIRCAFAALGRASLLLIAALRGHTPLPPLRYALVLGLVGSCAGGAS